MSGGAPSSDADVVRGGVAIWWGDARDGTDGTDECERVGSLSVAKGQSIVPKINQLREEKGRLFDMIIRSRDFHPPGHVSFSSAHFGDGSPNSGLDFMGGPITVGQAFDFSCVKAESGLLNVRV